MLLLVDGSPFSSDGYFQIDQSTGVISNRVVIDTDSQQIQQTGSTFSLTVIVGIDFFHTASYC
mgnify:CR=1 FL=1